ncbi:D-alanyl-D-alanine carboxypeptidase family protein [Candidatus Saccharibacteria bacterium]|nr:D-alanyl-D-alanine carboxypeptidase family protein [Candidatus Saccharibacteria bacterium]
MITRNKLSNQSENKLTKKFKPTEPQGHDGPSKPVVHKEKNKKKSKKMKFVALLFLVLILAFGATFGISWLVNKTSSSPSNSNTTDENTPEIADEEVPVVDSETKDETKALEPITSAASSNPTIQYGRLMLINPNFMVETSFIAARKSELISLSGTYGIEEFHAYNGDNLMDPEAAEWLNKMLSDYTLSNPGHSIKTVSCFREVGTTCGRLCMPTGASDHHTGLTCDLIDPTYGDSLDTDTYDQHIEWQWLKANSYNYGFIDRFPKSWSGGPMSEPMNVNEEGSTGLYETWHYRYVGLETANEIATGVYNNGQYDSLEHYLKARGLISNLLNQ